MSTPVDFGPQHEQVVALLGRLAAMTVDDADRVGARRARSAATVVDEVRERVWFAAPAGRNPAQRAALAGALNVVWDTLWSPLGDGGGVWGDVADAAAAAAIGLVLRDIIDPADYRLLTGPLASVFGPLHPDDEEET